MTHPDVPHATVAERGARRLAGGHPWIYRADIRQEPTAATPGVVAARDARGRHLGYALYSPQSEIRLRLLTRRQEPPDAEWWCDRVRAALTRRQGISATAYRVAHAEADGLPSLIVDRYGPYVVAQLLSAGLEAVRTEVVRAIDAVLRPRGILLRNDVRVRMHEDLPRTVELAAGEVPRFIDVEEHGIVYRVHPWTGQKTGGFLDQREHRALAGSVARGRALDLFTYQGWFALHLARRAHEVIAVEMSADGLAGARENAERNELRNIDWRHANAFDLVRDLERRGERFDVIVLDPPAFAKSKDSVPRALAGYKEINLRAMRLLATGGHLFTFSCSYHVGRGRFLAMAAQAAADSGRWLQLVRTLGQPIDHPEIMTVPESGYLKGAQLVAIDDPAAGERRPRRGPPSRAHARRARHDGGSPA